MSKPWRWGAGAATSGQPAADKTVRRVRVCRQAVVDGYRGHVDNGGRARQGQKHRRGGEEGACTVSLIPFLRLVVCQSTPSLPLRLCCFFLLPDLFIWSGPSRVPLHHAIQALWKRKRGKYECTLPASGHSKNTKEIQIEIVPMDGYWIDIVLCVAGGRFPRCAGRWTSHNPLGRVPGHDRWEVRRTVVDGRAPTTTAGRGRPKSARPLAEALRKGRSPLGRHSGTAG